MIRKFIVLFMFICTLMMLAACNDSTVPDQSSIEVKPNQLISTADSKITAEDMELYAAEIREIHERGKFTIALYSQDRNPFFYTDSEGNLAGSDVDIAKGIAAAFGVDVEFNRTAATFDEVVDIVASGQADLAISKLSQTLQRGKKVLFSEAYLSLRQALLINRLKLAEISTQSTNSLELVKESSEKIGVIKGTSYVGFAASLFPNAEIVQYDTEDKLYDAAFKGDILAAFFDEFEIKKHIEDHPAQSIELQTIIIEGKVDPIAIAVGAENQHLHAWINLFLKDHSLDIESLLKEYGILK